VHRGTWKRREREAAKRLGGVRIPVTGERAGADGLTAELAIQSKHGRNRPSYLTEWLAGIREAGRVRGKVGVVIWSTMHEPLDDAVVVMRFRDFEDLIARLPAGWKEEPPAGMLPESRGRR